jgi:hypothetical protein
MKRFSLSALVIGLALASSATALAAPPGRKAKPKKAPVTATESTKGEKAEKADKADSKAKSPADSTTTNEPTSTTTTTSSPVSFTQPADQQPAPDPAPSGGGTAPPTTAPAAGDSTGQPTTPAVSIGTSPATTPGSDTPATAPTEPAAKPKPRPFAGSALFIQNSMTTGTIFRGQQQDYNPTIESAMFMLPRYAINDAFQLRARAILNYEYTNSDTTRYRNEPTISDTTLQLFYRKIPKVLGFQPNIALNAGLPTSKASRARTLIFSPGATLQLVRGFEHVLGGEMLILSSFAYSHPIYQSRVPEAVDPRPANSFTCVGGGNCSDLLSGTMNPSDTLSYMLLVSQEWGKWNPAIMYLGASQWVYQPKAVTNPIDGTPVQSPNGFEPTSVRQTHYLSAWLDYNFNSWFTGEVGYWNAVTGLGENGQRSNLVFDRYQDTRVYLGASIQLDNLVKELQGGNQGEGGIIRAKNTKTPMWTF